MAEGNSAPKDSGLLFKALIYSCPQDVFTNYNYTPLRVLGRGMMGQVVLAQTSESTGFHLEAVKTFSKKTPDGGRMNQKLFMAEISVLQSIKHKYILGKVKAFDCPEEYTMCMPYYKNGTLKSRLRSLTIEVTDQYLLQLTSAVLYLHNHNLVHRDIKPANILISDDENVILSDFGLACVVKSTPVTRVRRCGTRGYIAPELNDPQRIRGQTIDLYKCDMYALGVVLWNMIFGMTAPPAGFDFLTALEFQPHIPDCYKNVVRNLLHADSNLRWDSNNLLATLETWPEMVELFEKYFDG